MQCGIKTDTELKVWKIHIPVTEYVVPIHHHLVSCQQVLASAQLMLASLIWHLMDSPKKKKIYHLRRNALIPSIIHWPVSYTLLHHVTSYHHNNTICSFRNYHICISCIAWKYNIRQQDCNNSGPTIISAGVDCIQSN